MFHGRQFFYPYQSHQHILVSQKTILPSTRILHHTLTYSRKQQRMNTIPMPHGIQQANTICHSLLLQTPMYFFFSSTNTLQTLLPAVCFRQISIQTQKYQNRTCEYSEAKTIHSDKTNKQCDVRLMVSKASIQASQESKEIPAEDERFLLDV